MTMTNVPKSNLIDLRLEDRVLYLSMNRPDSRNALSASLIEQMLAVLALCNGANSGKVEFDLKPFQLDAEQLSAVRAIVLRGVGGNFCSGGDIKDMFALVERGKMNHQHYIASYSALGGNLYSAVSSARAAVVAVLEGAVMGGGMGLAAAADIVIADRSAKFALPEAGLGLVPVQAAPFLRARLGLSYARMLAVLGGQVDAEEAMRIGLVHFLVENEDELAQTVQDLLKKIRACAPGALAAAKALFRSDRAAPSEKPEDLGIIFARSWVSEEAREGMAAFIEKRRPSWDQLEEK
jgi:isohexenylglutaconyl-CoA hydratase